MLWVSPGRPASLTCRSGDKSEWRWHGSRQHPPVPYSVGFAAWPVCPFKLQTFLRRKETQDSFWAQGRMPHKILLLLKQWLQMLHMAPHPLCHRSQLRVNGCSTWLCPCSRCLQSCCRVGRATGCRSPLSWHICSCQSDVRESSDVRHL